MAPHSLLTFASWCAPCALYRVRAPAHVCASCKFTWIKIVSERWWMAQLGRKPRKNRGHIPRKNRGHKARSNSLNLGLRFDFSPFLLQDRQLSSQILGTLKLSPGAAPNAIYNSQDGAHAHTSAQQPPAHGCALTRDSVRYRTLHGLSSSTTVSIHSPIALKLYRHFLRQNKPFWATQLL
jgi:hypothetical protein